jgi:hypothetical protein
VGVKNKKIEIIDQHMNGIYQKQSWEKTLTNGTFGFFIMFSPD